jgi:hypothetical protein
MFSIDKSVSEVYDSEPVLEPDSELELELDADAWNPT